MPTPYDNRIILWQWKGDSLSENSIDDLAQSIKRWAPVVAAVVVKTSDGSDWQGAYDQSPSLAINGPDSVDRWVQALSKYNNNAGEMSRLTDQIVKAIRKGR